MSAPTHQWWHEETKLPVWGGKVVPPAGTPASTLRARHVPATRKSVIIEDDRNRVLATAIYRSPAAEQAISYGGSWEVTLTIPDSHVQHRTFYLAGLGEYALDEALKAIVIGYRSFTPVTTLDKGKNNNAQHR